MKQMFLGNLTMTVKWPSSILDLSNHQRLLLLPIRLGTGNSKRSLYNDQLPEPTEAESAAYGVLGLFLREEEPPGAKGTQNSQCPLLPGCRSITSGRGSPVAVAAINQPGTIGQGERVRPEVYAGRPFWEQGEAGMGTWLEHRSGIPPENPIRKSIQKDSEQPWTFLSQELGPVLNWSSLSIGRACMGDNGKRGTCVLLCPWQHPSPFKGQ